MTSPASKRSTSKPSDRNQASRRASRSGLSPIEWLSPSTSTTSRAPAQRKSAVHRSNGCCRRNLSPAGRKRSACHKRYSGGVGSRRSWRARFTALFRRVNGLRRGMSPLHHLRWSPSPPLRDGEADSQHLHLGLALGFGRLASYSAES